MKAWVYQAYAHKQRYGLKAPWSVGWYDPDGQRKGKLIGPKPKAESECRRIIAQLEAGTYNSPKRKSWEAFRRSTKTRSCRCWTRTRSRRS